MNWSSGWSPLRVLIFILLKCGMSWRTLAMEDSGYPRLIVAASHTALSGDLGVVILNMPGLDYPTTALKTTTEGEDLDMEEEDTEDPYVLRVSLLNGFASELIGEVEIDKPFRSGENISLTIPCGFFSRGGTYSLKLQRKSSPEPKFTDIADFHEIQMRTILDVRWPLPSLSIEPQHFNTYPVQPVFATLEYNGISCAASKGVPIAMYTLELIYCGKSFSSCDPRNKSQGQTLDSVEVKGFPIQKIINLRCELFGVDGQYALRLRPTAANPSAPALSVYTKVEWSQQYVFNVHARSIFPCDGASGGISVLFEYPSCRLQGDRVRVYGRLTADVASSAPPSKLHYVAELKAPPGKHSLTFDCDIFTERFVEYCFVYVSEAYTGAMTDVRLECIPTFPLRGDAGNWGPWSQWTQCTSSCVGGTRTRYRFCDKPEPQYGAKYCQGEAVETEACGGASQVDLHGTWNLGDWECRHGKALAADRPEVTAEIGSKCRCGCAVKLSDEKPRRILAASTQACPGRSFWLVEAEENFAVRLHFDQARFPCPEQYVRVRDGDSLSAELLADIAFDKKSPGNVVSSGQNLLVEFFSDELAAAGESCVGGFLAHVTVFRKPASENGTISPVLAHPKIMTAAGRWALWLTPAHLVAASLLILMFLVSVFLALQYVVKYRKYHIAEDLDSLTDNSACSGSMQGLARRARAMSSSTLISEVVSLVRLPRRSSPKHATLGEAAGDVEDGYESTETQVEGEDEQSVESGTLKPKENEEIGSQKTIVNSVVSTPTRRSSTSSNSALGQPEVKYARPVKLRTVGPISPVSEEAASTSEESRRYSITSASTSVNNGFSPASTSSNISTLVRGKESKDRRNRERLLQGPGSEFSLANPEMDLELDYYDYNVVNAGAAPGSYLGMDPAFLVWIPPLDPGESEILGAIEEDHHYEEIPDRRSDLRLDTEGAALTPAEYQQIKQTNDDVSDSQVLTKKLDPGECRLHDKIITEYRARLSEGMLPIHRILEESRVRVSEESLARQEDCSSIDVIPNRLQEDFTPKSTRNRLLLEEEKSKTSSLPRRCEDDAEGGLERGVRTKRHRRNSQNEENEQTKSAASIRGRLLEEEMKSKGNLSRISGASSGRQQIDHDQESSRKNSSGKIPKRGKDGRDLGRDHCESKGPEEERSEMIMPRTPRFPRKFKDITDFNNMSTESQKADIVNIPLREFPKRLQSPVRVHKAMDVKKDIQSPDYGVEADLQETKDSFYDLIGEGEEALKFADDDDDYIDNKVTF